MARKPRRTFYDVTRGLSLEQLKDLGVFHSDRLEWISYLINKRINAGEK